MGGIKQDNSGQLTCGCGTDNFALKAAFDQQRQATAVVKMGMGEQYIVNAGGIEAKFRSIVLIEFMTALKQAAVDQDFLSGTFKHVTGTGDVAICAVEGEFHCWQFPCLFSLSDVDTKVMGLEQAIMKKVSAMLANV